MSKTKKHKNDFPKSPKDNNLYIGVWFNKNYHLPMIVYDNKDVIKAYFTDYVGLQYDEYREEYYYIESVKYDENIHDVLSKFYGDLNNQDIDIFNLDPWPNAYAYSKGILISNFDFRIIQKEFTELINEVQSGINAVSKLHLILSNPNIESIPNKSDFLEKSAKDTFSVFNYTLAHKKKLLKSMLRCISPYCNMNLDELINYIKDPANYHILQSQTNYHIFGIDNNE